MIEDICVKLSLKIKKNYRNKFITMKGEIAR